MRDHTDVDLPLRLLSQVKITSIDTLKHALSILHSAPFGVKNVAISSIPLPISLVKRLNLPEAPSSYTSLLPAKGSAESEDITIGLQQERDLKVQLTQGLQGGTETEPEVLVCFASTRWGDAQVEFKTYGFALPTVGGYFSGVGDLFSALVLGFYDPSSQSADGLPPFARAVSLALLGVQQLLLKTHLHSLSIAAPRKKTDRAAFDANNPDDCLPSDEELDSIPPTPVTDGTKPIPARIARRMRKRELRLVQERGLLMRLGLDGSPGWPCKEVDWHAL